MIKGFEDVTTKISDYEKERILPLVVEVLKHRVGAKKAATNKKIREYLQLEDGIIIDAITMRRIISYIRKNSLVPCLIATSKGYYVAEEEKEINDYLESLQGRIEAIRSVSTSLKRQLRKRFGKKKPADS
jgi:carbamoylphosphate synthase small subunit